MLTEAGHSPTQNLIYWVMCRVRGILLEDFGISPYIVVNNVFLIIIIPRLANQSFYRVNLHLLRQHGCILAYYLSFQKLKDCSWQFTSPHDVYTSELLKPVTMSEKVCRE